MQYNVKVKRLPKSEVEIEAIIPSVELEKAHKKALRKFSETIDVPGFRKGSVPEKMVLEKLGNQVVLQEAAELAINDHYSLILQETKLDTIGRPSISLTKLALGNDLEFKVRTAVIPEFDLPDYKKIAKDTIEKEKSKEEKIEVTEKEIGEVILQIRKNKAHYDWHKSNPETDHHDHPDFNKDENLPIFDDQFAKSAGNFKDVEEFKAKIKENIAEEKKNRNNEKCYRNCKRKPGYHSDANGFVRNYLWFRKL